MAEVQQPKLVHKQFNSPIGLYSENNIAETINREMKAVGGKGIDLDNQISSKPSHLANSYVLKMLQEEESEKYLVKNRKQQYSRYLKSNNINSSSPNYNNNRVNHLNNEIKNTINEASGNGKKSGGKSFHHQENTMKQQQEQTIERSSKNFNVSRSSERQSRPRHRFEHHQKTSTVPPKVIVNRDTVLKINRRHPNFYRDISWPPPNNCEPRSQSEDNCYYFDENIQNTMNQNQKEVAEKIIQQPKLHKFNFVESTNSNKLTFSNYFPDGCTTTTTTDNSNNNNNDNINNRNEFSNAKVMEKILPSYNSNNKITIDHTLNSSNGKSNNNNIQSNDNYNMNNTKSNKIVAATVSSSSSNLSNNEYHQPLLQQHQPTVEYAKDVPSYYISSTIENHISNITFKDKKSKNNIHCHKISADATIPSSVITRSNRINISNGNKITCQNQQLQTRHHSRHGNVDNSYNTSSCFRNYDDISRDAYDQNSLSHSTVGIVDNYNKDIKLNNKNENPKKDMLNLTEVNENIKTNSTTESRNDILSSINLPKLILTQSLSIETNEIENNKDEIPFPSPASSTYDNIEDINHSTITMNDDDQKLHDTSTNKCYANRKIVIVPSSNNKEAQQFGKEIINNKKDSNQNENEKNMKISTDENEIEILRQQELELLHHVQQQNLKKLQKKIIFGQKTIVDNKPNEISINKDDFCQQYQQQQQQQKPISGESQANIDVKSDDDETIKEENSKFNIYKMSISTDQNNNNNKVEMNFDENLKNSKTKNINNINPIDQLKNQQTSTNTTTASINAVINTDENYLKMQSHPQKSHHQQTENINVSFATTDDDHNKETFKNNIINSIKNASTTTSKNNFQLNTTDELPETYNDDDTNLIIRNQNILSSQYIPEKTNRIIELEQQNNEPHKKQNENNQNYAVAREEKKYQNQQKHKKINKNELNLKDSKNKVQKYFEDVDMIIFQNTKTNNNNISNQIQETNIDEICVNQQTNTTITNNESEMNNYTKSVLPTKSIISEKLNNFVESTTPPISLTSGKPPLQELLLSQSIISNDDNQKNITENIRYSQTKLCKLPNINDDRDASNEKHYISKKFFKIRSISQPPPLEYLKMYSADGESIVQSFLHNRKSDNVDNGEFDIDTDRDDAIDQHSKIENFKKILSSNDTGTTTTFSSNNFNFNNNKITLIGTDSLQLNSDESNNSLQERPNNYTNKCRIGATDDNDSEIIDGDNNNCDKSICSTHPKQHQTSSSVEEMNEDEGYHNLKEQKLDIHQNDEKTNNSIMNKKRTHQNNHHCHYDYDYYSSDPSLYHLYFKDETVEQEDSNDDGLYQWINDDEGYKRVAWPPTLDRKIIREFTPQPQGDSNQSNQSMPNTNERQSPAISGYDHQQQQNYSPQQPSEQLHHGQQYHNNQLSNHYPNQNQSPYQSLSQSTDQNNNAHYPQYNQQQQQYNNEQPEYNSQSYIPQQQYNSQSGQIGGGQIGGGQIGGGQPQQYNQQQQQQQPHHDQQAPHSGIVTLRKDPPYTQKPAPTVVSQPAAKSLRGGSIMRGDLKWPPQDCRERMAAEEELQRQLALGPENRPVRMPKDYSGFFASHALSHYYPGYKIPPGTQHMYADMF